MMQCQGGKHGAEACVNEKGHRPRQHMECFILEHRLRCMYALCALARANL